MKYLFLFAHPDDESFGCAGTIKRLTENGDEVTLVSVTDGGAGEVMEKAQERLKELGSVGAVRREEIEQVGQFLGVTKLQVLNYADGEITNQMVWGKLVTTFITLIDEVKPDVIITFDHSGWYFHLDHVGVSIATTLAFQQSEHRPHALLLSHLKVNENRWKYIFPTQLPATHAVDISQYRNVKSQALALHASQDAASIIQKLNDQEAHQEFYQLALSSPEGNTLLENHPVFKRL